MNKKLKSKSNSHVERHDSMTRCANIAINVEDNADKVNVAKNNHKTHATNGNVKLKEFSILQMNKGDADFVTKRDLVIANIVEVDADITFISKANTCPEVIH